jgi:hypothetical protein
VQLAPKLAIAYNALGATLRDRLKIDESITCFREAARLDPHFDLARSNLGMLLLVRGDFKEGWDFYEARRTALDIDAKMKTSRWRGEQGADKTVVVFGEQGLGDTIHFLRYLPLIKQRVGRVILMCLNELINLVRTARCCDEVITMEAELPQHDCYIPMLSLAGVFATNQDTIPSLVPLKSSHNDPTFRIEAHGDAAMNVGLSWAGSPVHSGDRKRSCGLAALEPLTRIKHTRFFTLQIGPQLRELNDLVLVGGASEIIDCSTHDTSLVATAAIIQQLDLVITVDTAIAHLAGALGKPVWVLLPYAPDWRWMLERQDTRWYPSMRLFRQPVPGDWASAVDHVQHELAHLTKEAARNKV